MNYQVLARKWRPQRFADVVGQQHVLTALINALSQGRLHHAYLFSGTRGVGKTSIARLLAKALNCDTGITAEPCGVCTSCQEIEQGRFVDLLEIDAASRTKVEDTRELLDNVQYQPARGRFKVYLIDEVHMLSRHSFNALLKTLEEPPPHVKFLLATTDPQKLPITILSRCLQFHLKSLEPEQIDTQLQHILQQEQLSFEGQATAALSRAADGSLRDALSLTDQALAFGNGEIKLAQVESMLGNLNHSQLMALIGAVLAGDGPALLTRVAELASMGPDYDQIHKELVGFWHQLALAQVIPAPPVVPYAAELNRLAPLVSAEQIQLYYQICLQGRKDLPFAADGRSALEMTLLRGLAFQPHSPVADVPQNNTAIPTDNASAIAGILNVEVPTPKKPEPPAANSDDTPALDTVDAADDSMAAQLYHEQTTILTQAERLGHESATAQTLLTPEPEPTERLPKPSTVEVAKSESAEPNVATVKPAPAADTSPAIPPANTDLAAPLPEAEQPFDAPDAEPETMSEADPAAANVARIRRLLQTRNRLRSHELDTSEPAAMPLRQPEPQAAPIKDEKERPTPPSSSPSVALTQPATPVVSEHIQQGHQAGVSSQHLAQAEHTDQDNELPPLDAYADMEQQDADDLPPWLDDAPGASAPRPRPAQVPNSAKPIKSEAPFFSVPSAPLVHLTAKPASTDGDPLPVKPSSLLTQAEDKWTLMVADLPLGGLLRQLAMHSCLEQQSQLQWQLWLRPEHRHLLSEKSREELHVILQQYNNAEIQLQIAVGESNQGLTPADIEQQLYQSAITQAKDEMVADDAVQFLISRFAAELDHDSIEPMAE